MSIQTSPVPLRGVWVTYSYDVGVVVDSVYADEVSALRAAVKSGYLKVVLLAFGQNIHDAIADGAVAEAKS